MNTRWPRSLGYVVCLIALQLIALPARSARPDEQPSATIVCAPAPGDCEILAAREIRRYALLRTGACPPILTTGALPPRGDAIVVATRNRAIITALTLTTKTRETIASLAPQQYALTSVPDRGRRVMLVVGGDDAGLLRGAYRLAEHLGVRFFLHGDVVPDRRVAWKLPEVDEVGKPLFRLRGLNPWGSHPFGFDQWSADDYIAHIGQLAKMGMNFIGMHCYPEGHPYAEPTVWHGLAGDFDDRGRVEQSYVARYFNTSLQTAWAIAPKKTSDYSFGGALLFETDAYGPDAMRGLTPVPDTPQECNELFDRIAEQFLQAFSFARLVGVKTCVGTESPLVLPRALRDRIAARGDDPTHPEVIRRVYEATFRRIQAAHPLDYFWLWTPESWTWRGNTEQQMKATIDDIKIARNALRNVGAPFELATAGWVLGPGDDRAAFDRWLPEDIAVSAISRRLGHDAIDPAFDRIDGRSKWAIPWLESDSYHGLANPQLFVGRMRRDAADALAYRCDGLMGLQWRTRVLGPNASALAQACWTQTPWNPTSGRLPSGPGVRAGEALGALGGQIADYPGREIADTDDDTVYRTCRYDLRGYRLDVPDGTYRVTLQFCEPHFNARGKRVCDVQLQGVRVLERLDIFGEVGQFAAYDRSFADVQVRDGLLRIDFVKIVSLPCISGIVIENDDLTRKINCGGPRVGEYAADPAPKPVRAGFANRGLPVDDFYVDWCRASFGVEVAGDAATIFSRLDGRLPLSIGNSCPSGRFRPNSAPWSAVRDEFAFVGQLEAVRPRVRGAGSLERFDYWLNTFRYFRQQALVQCLYSDFVRTMARVEKEPDASRRSALAEREALPLLRRIVEEYGRMYGHRLDAVTTHGGIMTIVNMEQCRGWWKAVIDDTRTRLETALGHPVPDDAKPTRAYRGDMRVIVPTVRSCGYAGESLRLRVIVLSQRPPRRAVLHVRPLGSTEAFETTPLVHVARGVWRVDLPPLGVDRGLEYHIEAVAEDGGSTYFPPTAPDVGQTVIAVPGGPWSERASGR